MKEKKGRHYLPPLGCPPTSKHEWNVKHAHGEEKGEKGKEERGKRKIARKEPSRRDTLAGFFVSILSGLDRELI